MSKRVHCEKCPTAPRMRVYKVTHPTEKMIRRYFECPQCSSRSVQEEIRESVRLTLRQLTKEDMGIE